MRTASSHFAPLDGLRGLAILMVIATHTIDGPGRTGVENGMFLIAKTGWTGVTLFFALSGFLISGILLDTRHRKQSLRSFLARRSLRIFPIYFGFLAAYFFLLPHVFPSLPRVAPHERIYYWTYLTNIKQWLSGSLAGCPPLAPLWSLSVEEQIYLAWPLLILFLPARQLGPLFAALAVGSVVWRIMAFRSGMPTLWIYTWTPGNIEPFAYGGLVAWLSRNPGGQRLLKLWSLPICLCAGLTILTFIGIYHHFNLWSNSYFMMTAGMSLSAIFAASLIALTITTRDSALLNRCLSWSMLRYTGRFSYAMYLFHVTVIVLLRPYFQHPTSIGGGGASRPVLLLALYAAVCAVSFGAAAISWFGFESHFLKLKRFFPSGGRVVRLSPAEEPGPVPVTSVPPSLTGI